MGGTQNGYSGPARAVLAERGLQVLITSSRRAM